MKIKALIIIFAVFVLTLSCVSANETIENQTISMDEYSEDTTIPIILSRSNISSSLYTPQTNSNSNNNYTLDSYGEIVPSDSVEETKDSKIPEIPYCNRTLPLDQLLNYIEDKGSSFKNYTISSLKNHGIIPDYNIDDYNITELQELGYSDEFIQQHLGRNMINKTNFNDIVFWSCIAELDGDHHDKIAKQLYGEEPNKVTSKEKVGVIMNKTMNNLIKHGLGYVNCKAIAKVDDCIRARRLNTINAEIHEAGLKLSIALSDQEGYKNDINYITHKNLYDWLEIEDKVLHNIYGKDNVDMGFGTYKKYVELKHSISNGGQIETLEQNDLWYQCQEAYIKFEEFKNKYDSSVEGKELHEYIVTDYLNVLGDLKKTCNRMKLYLLNEFIGESRTEEVSWLNSYEHEYGKIDRAVEKLTKQLNALKLKKEKLKEWDSVNTFTFTYSMYLGLKFGFDIILLNKNIDKHFIEYEPISDYEMEGYLKYYQNRVVGSLNDS